jgi:hypothetical protein
VGLVNSSKVNSFSKVNRASKVLSLSNKVNKVVTLSSSNSNTLSSSSSSREACSLATATTRASTATLALRVDLEATPAVVVGMHTVTVDEEVLPEAVTGDETRTKSEWRDLRSSAYRRSWPNNRTFLSSQVSFSEHQRKNLLSFFSRSSRGMSKEVVVILSRNALALSQLALRSWHKSALQYVKATTRDAGKMVRGTGPLDTALYMRTEAMIEHDRLTPGVSKCRCVG